MYIATFYPYILSIANVSFVSFVNVRGHGGKPLAKTTKSKSFELQRNLRKRQLLVSSRHLLTRS